MARLFEKADAVINPVVRWLVIILSLLVAVGMVLGIVMRSALNAPMLGLEEIILFSVMWLYMMGAALASRDRSHLSADFVAVFVKRKALRDGLHLIASLISLIMVLAFVVWSFDLLAWGVSRQQTTPVFRIPQFLSQASIFAASLLFLFYLLRDMGEDLEKLRNRNS